MFYTGIFLKTEDYGERPPYMQGHLIFGSIQYVIFEE